MARETDVVVVGMGGGGEHVAERLAEEGLDVVGVEAELVGGGCPHWACIPSKMSSGCGARGCRADASGPRPAGAFRRIIVAVALALSWSCRQAMAYPAT